MNEPGVNGSSKTKSLRWRRWGVLLLIAVALLELLYLLAGNLAINSDWLQARINGRPARVSVTWASGSTWLPGRVHLEDVKVVGQARKTQYSVTFSSGQFSVSIWRLFSRHVHVRTGLANGLDVRLRRRLDTAEVKEGAERHFPPIDGLQNPPTEKPEELYPRRQPGQPWTITVDHFQVQQLQQVWVNGIKLEGDGEITTGFKMVVRGDMEVPQAHLTTSNAKLSMGQNVLAEGITMTADLHLKPYPYKEIKGKEILGQLSAVIRMQGDLKTLAFVDDHGGSQAGVRFGGTGQIDAEINIQEGRFMPGSVYSVDAQRLDVEFLDYAFRSSGTVRGKAWQEDGQMMGGTEIELAKLTGHPVAREDLTLTVSGFTFKSVVDDPVLTGEEPLRQIEINMPAISIPEIAMFNDLLPETLTTQFLNGSARMGARYVIDATGGASGTLQLKGSDLVAQAHDGEFSGDLSLDAFYRSDDFRAATYDLGGTSLSISKVFMTETQKKKDQLGWWFDVLLSEARIDITDGAHVDATADFSMRDIKPLVILLKEDENAPKWFGMMPNVKDVEGNVQLDLDPAEFDIESMDITGKGMKFRGRLETSNGIKRGVFYAKYKGLAVGIALDDSDEKKKKRWTIRKPLAWYEEKLEELDLSAKD